MIMGDLNTKIRKVKCEALIGEHWLGDRNERGESVVELIKKVTNPFYQLQTRRISTSK